MRLTPREVFIGGLCALAYPLGVHLAARITGHHYLSIDLNFKEKP